jgi:hypothetical protein
VDKTAFDKRVGRWIKLMEKQHNSLYHSYKGGLEYKDYWGGDKVKVTISSALRNLNKEQVILNQDVYSLMHKSN